MTVLSKCVRVCVCVHVKLYEHIEKNYGHEGLNWPNWPRNLLRRCTEGWLKQWGGVQPCCELESSQISDSPLTIMDPNGHTYCL